MLNRHCTTQVCELSVLLGIVGHEAGHLLFSHAPYDPNNCVFNHNQELQADALAGWVLAARGMPRSDLEAVIGELAFEEHCTHPLAIHRLSAIRYGFDARMRGEPWQPIGQLQFEEAYQARPAHSYR